jgi:SpoIID/LytB domain protein
VADKTADIDDYLNAATLFKETGNYSKAFEIISLIGVNNNSVKSYQARLAYLSGDSNSALNLYRQLKRKSWLDMVYAGFAYEDSGRIQEAIESYKSSLSSRENSLALFCLAKLYYQKQDYSRATDLFRRLIKLDSSIRLAYYYLGKCLLETGSLKESYKNLSKAFGFYPENTGIKCSLEAVKNKLGKSYFLKKKDEKDAQRSQAKPSLYEASFPELLIVRVGLAKGLREFSFSCRKEFLITDNLEIFNGEPEKIYTLRQDADGLVLEDYKNKNKYCSFSCPVSISVSGSGQKKAPFYIFDMVYGEGNFWHKKIDRAFRGGIEVILRNNRMTLVNKVSVEEYLYGILAAEIPASSERGALLAQAVAARTLVFRNLGRHKKEGFDFCCDVHCQVYQGLSAETPQTLKAVDETEGEILVFGGKPIEAFYHSNCGGCLCADTFGTSPYLANGIDAASGKLPKGLYRQQEWFLQDPEVFCALRDDGRFRWQRVYDRQDFLLAFGFAMDELEDIFCREKGDCYHYKEVEIALKGRKEMLKGDLEIRNYFDALRSSAFILEIIKDPKGKIQKLIFFGAGFGHGAGLCQAGAIGMAKDGYDYKDILKHYYPKAVIEKKY